MKVENKEQKNQKNWSQRPHYSENKVLSSLIISSASLRACTKVQKRNFISRFIWRTYRFIFETDESYINITHHRAINRV